MDKVKKIMNILNKYDPIELIDLGCPKDEYLPEAKLLAALLPFAMYKDHCHVFVRFCFEFFFGKRVTELHWHNFSKMGNVLWKEVVGVDQKRRWKGYEREWEGDEHWVTSSHS